MASQVGGVSGASDSDPSSGEADIEQNFSQLQQTAKNISGFNSKVSEFQRKTDRGFIA